MGGAPWGGAPQANPAGGGLDFSALLGAGAGGGNNFMGTRAVPPSASAAPTPPQDPATRYATQLQILRDMGFPDDAANLRALGNANGNVNAAIEALLNGA